MEQLCWEKQEMGGGGSRVDKGTVSSLQGQGQLDGRGRLGGAFIQMASDKTPQTSQVTRGPG